MNIIRYNSFRWVNLFSRNSFFYKYGDECLEVIMAYVRI